MEGEQSSSDEEEPFSCEMGPKRFFSSDVQMYSRQSTYVKHLLPIDLAQKTPKEMFISGMKKRPQVLV